MASETNTTLFVQATSITISLLGAGGIATLSAFDVPELKSQPASRSLPSIRWLFSRGSHIFPQAAGIASAGFLYLANTSLPASQSFTHLVNVFKNNGKVNGYLAAAALCISIAPWTTMVMVPTNFELMKRNAERGGKRSVESKNETEAKGTAGETKSAEDSKAGKGEINEATDLSGPQEKAGGKIGEKDEREVKELLERFVWLNWVRAGLLGVGGVAGLVVALA